MKLDSPTAVRVLNDALDQGIPASLTLEPFDNANVGLTPAGSVIFPFGNKSPDADALHAVVSGSGIWVERNQQASQPASQSLTSQKIAVLTNSNNDAVWALRNLGFQADAVSTAGALNNITLPDPLADYDVVFNTSGWPSGTTARDRLTAFFDAGGGYVGGGSAGTTFISTGANQFSGLTAATTSGNGQSGILEWANPGAGSSPVTGAYPSTDTFIRRSHHLVHRGAGDGIGRWEVPCWG